jgi:hypothetical protein
MSRNPLCFFPCIFFLPLAAPPPMLCVCVCVCVRACVRVCACVCAIRCQLQKRPTKSVKRDLLKVSNETYCVCVRARVRIEATHQKEDVVI